MSKHHRHHSNHRQNVQPENNNTQNNNTQNNNQQKHNTQNNNPFSQLLNGGGNDLMNLISGLNGGDGLNNIMPNSTGGQDGNPISNLMSGLNNGSNPLSNIMSGLSNGGNPLSNIMSSLSQTDLSQLGNLLGGMNNQNQQPNKVNKNSPKANMKVNDELKNLAFDFNNIDINEISNIISNIDFDEVDFENMDINEIMDNIPENINDEEEIDLKHKKINENTYNAIKDAPDEDILQMFNIFAQLIDKRKLKILKEILKSCH